MPSRNTSEVSALTPPADITLDNETIALIEEHVRRLFEVMGFSQIKVRCYLIELSRLHIVVEAGEVGRMLIGAHGGHLLALQHIIRCLLRRQFDRVPYITVDVNGYRARRERSLLSLAEEVARKAQRTGRTVVLQPMSSVDRRAIHSALANHKDIRTESLGNEPNRRVVVKPVFL